MAAELTKEYIILHGFGNFGALCCGTILYDHGGNEIGRNEAPDTGVVQILAP